MAAMTADWTAESRVLLTAERMDGMKAVQWAATKADLTVATKAGP